MDYQDIKQHSRAFMRQHPAYFWSSLELAMICAAAYSIFGLMNMVTGAMATDSSVIMILEFMAAPLYAVLLFAIVSAALTLVMVLPFALISQLRVQQLTAELVPVEAAAAAKKSRRSSQAAKSAKKSRRQTA